MRRRWPVIVAIIVVSLVLFSILWCIIRCACCGMSCCCTCFSFLKCCDCCGGCCDGRRDRPHKHLDDLPDSYPPHQGYQPNAPMMGGGLAAASAPAPPQFAQFDVGKSGHAVSSQSLNEDALPAMPSWETASKKHVLDEEKDAVELGELDPATGQRLPLMAGAAGTGVSSPSTPSNEYAAGPFGQNQNGFNQNQGGYRGTPSPGPAMMGGRGPGQNGMNNYGPLRGASPGPGMMGGRGYGPGQNGMDNYGQPSFRGASPGPGMMGGRYGPGQNGMGNSDPQSFRGASPGPNGFVDTAVGGYGQPQAQYPNDRRQFAPQPSRQYSSESARGMNPGRQYSPAPQDGFQQHGFQQNGPSYGPSGGARSPPPTHNTGFDFGIDNQQQYSSRPSPPPQQPSYGSPVRSYSPSPNLQQRGGCAGYHPGSTAPPSYATRTPPPQEQTYEAYAPPSDQGRRGPSGGRREEPQHWDPVQQ